MALRSGDRVKETTTTTGTGTVTLGGAVSGFQAFSAICADGDQVAYAIVGPTEWEVGIGTYTAAGALLARTVVLASSNAGALVNFSAGSKDVFDTHPGQHGLAPIASRVASVDTLVPAGCSLYVASDYEVASGRVLEAGADAVVEVG